MSERIAALARPEILELKPYSHARWVPGVTRLHANEAPWRQASDPTAAGLNRYPEPQPAALIDAFARLYGVAREQILVTRGSDEAIDLLSRVFLRAGRDGIMQFSPTFGMYRIAARIQGGEILDLPLDANFQIDVEAALAAWQPQHKLIYLCSPNNPTGNRIEESRVLALCRALDGKAMIVIDEAYVEWSGARSYAAAIDRFETIAVLRTLSKAHALAGARCGTLLARASLIELIRRIIEPYNLTQGSIESALAALSPAALVMTRQRVAGLLKERTRIATALAGLPTIRRVWPSDANFLLLDCADADRLLNSASAASILVRDMRGHSALPRAIRLTIGSREQNDALLAAWEHA